MITEDDLTRVRELELLTQDIEHSVAWQQAMKELQTKSDNLDNHWQTAPQDKIFELQVTKLAIMEVITIIDDWRDELAELKQRIADEQSPSGVQDGDFDNE